MDGAEVGQVGTLQAGTYASADYEGPEEGLAEARRSFAAWAQEHGHPVSPILQVHHMDPMDGIVEEQLQMFLGP